MTDAAPSPEGPTAPMSPTTILAIAFGLAALAVGVFYVAAPSYFAGKLRGIPPAAAEAMAGQQAMARLPMFAAFAIVGAGTIAAAQAWSRQAAIALVGALGVANLVAAASGWRAEAVPPLLVATLLVVAALLAWWGIAFARRGDRAAWAGLVAVCGVFALVTFFGAPKVASLLGVSIWGALIAPATYLAAMMALRNAEPREA
ncbi:MAG: hypothetical protein R2939_15585 [Kofleriaceae bacterium]